MEEDADDAQRQHGFGFQREVKAPPGGLLEHVLESVEV
jgi:hypothetical protein